MYTQCAYILVNNHSSEKPQIIEVVSNFCDEVHCYFEILGEDVHIQYIWRT